MIPGGGPLASFRRSDDVLAFVQPFLDRHRPWQTTSSGNDDSQPPNSPTKPTLKCREWLGPGSRRALERSITLAVEALTVSLGRPFAHHTAGVVGRSVAGYWADGM